MRLCLKIGMPLVVLLTCQQVMLAQSPKPALVVSGSCKIYSNPSAYDGVMVRIRAVYSGSFEGSYLSDIKCFDKSLWFTAPEGIASMAAANLGGRSYPKVAEPDFTLVKDKEYEKFTRFAYATVENLEPAYRVTATFTGRLDRCRDFRLGKNWVGNGFGQMGQSEYQLVLKSVSEIDVEQATGHVETVPSKLPDDISERPHP